MKRLSILILIACLLCMTFACAKKSVEPAPEPEISVPSEREVTLTLPLLSRSDVAETLSRYTAGFSAASGEPLRFTVGSGDVYRQSQKLL